jgi:2-dehydropantoate 2-reductase
LIKALGCQSKVDLENIVHINTTLGHKPSVLQDLLARRPMEVNSLYNVTLQLAEMTGVRMPTLEVLASLIRVKVKALGL